MFTFDAYLGFVLIFSAFLWRRPVQNGWRSCWNCLKFCRKVARGIDGWWFKKIKTAEKLKDLFLCYCAVSEHEFMSETSSLPHTAEWADTDVSGVPARQPWCGADTFPLLVAITDRAPLPSSSLLFFRSTVTKTDIGKYRKSCKK